MRSLPANSLLRRGEAKLCASGAGQNLVPPWYRDRGRRESSCSSRYRLLCEAGRRKESERIRRCNEVRRAVGACRPARRGTPSTAKEVRAFPDQPAYGTCSGFMSLSRFQCTASSVRLVLSHWVSLSVRGGRKKYASFAR